MTDSTTSEPPRGGRKRRRLGFWWWLGITLAFVIGLPVAAVTAWSIGASRRAEAELDLIRAAGEPVTPADLEAFYAPPPPDEDVTELWLEAMRLVEVPEFYKAAESLPYVGDGAPPPDDGPWPEQERAKVFLAQFHRAIELCHLASNRGGKARFPTNYAKPFSLNGWEGGKYRLVFVLELDIATQTRQGDAGKALASLIALLRFGSAIGNQPMVVPFLRGTNIDGMACRHIEESLAWVTLPDADVTALQAELRAKSYQDGLHRGLLGDRAQTAEFIAQCSTDLEFTADSPPITEITRSNDLLRHLRYSRQMIETADLPWAKGDSAREQIADRHEREVTGDIFGRWTHPILLAYETFPVNYNYFYAALRADVMAAITDVGLAAELYRRRHADFPERLDQLVPDFLPAVPEDPFDGQSLRYIRRDDACVIYSIGIDQTDDGGVEEKQSTKPDITFTVRKPRAM